ncbi:MAG: GNAT family N-acetyltransferase [Planctomycetota bacterium]|jgi:ribosomal protein S18 acetylase RimI-like enzyme
MSGLQILPAGPEHAAAFFEIASSVKFRPEDADANRGFLVLPASVDWWSQALAQRTASQVAMENGEVVGFIYAPSEGRKLRIDRIAVRETHVRRGIGQLLLDAARAEAGEPETYALIMHAPVCNKASIAFFGGRNNFRLRTEVRTLGVASGPAYIWGRYVFP